MADTRKTFRIDAKDDASSVFGKIGAAAQRELGKVEEAADDGASAGKRMADALRSVADDVERDLQDTARAADKLGEALGPELRAKIGDAGLDRFVTDLRTAGVSVDEIETEAEGTRRRSEADGRRVHAGDSASAAGVRRRRHLRAQGR